ncbi:MAG: carboxylating nicotinate-nucleotide diphosphorylase [Veillonellaceae bacterium]|nr:carboxylating nicotinate-nucleotide diphosphorylase [Veillonellaceae bacterium]
MNLLALDELLYRALNEDLGQGDATSESIFSADHTSHGFLLAKQDFVLAGRGVFARVFGLLDARVDVTFFRNDGEAINQGERFACIEGPTLAILSGERIALNFLQHLSGIATETQSYVKACGNSGAMVVDTRKTTPGLRMLEKYAVTVGGGKNHRFGLNSMILIKDNHIRAAGGIEPAVRLVRAKSSPFLKIEVEAEELSQVREALAAGVEVIMLDNMTTEMIAEAVRVISGQALVEVSGNVTCEQIETLAGLGVDIISSGALTHSVKAVDISLKLE